MELVFLALVSIAFLSIAIQSELGERRGHRATVSGLLLVTALYVWALLTLGWFAPGGLYFSLVMGPIALVPFAAVSLSGLVLGVRLLMAASYLLRGVARPEPIARIARHSHLHHLAVFVVFVVTGIVLAALGSLVEASILVVYVSVACGIGWLIGAALGRAGLSDHAASRYSRLDAEEAA